MKFKTEIKRRGERARVAAPREVQLTHATTKVK
jgi:hypothetical protein